MAQLWTTATAAATYTAMSYRYRHSCVLQLCATSAPTAPAAATAATTYTAAATVIATRLQLQQQRPSAIVMLFRRHQLEHIQ